MQNADRVKAGFSDRFIAIPPEGSPESYRDMEAFIATVLSRRVQERLEDAISRRGAFRYFKDALLVYLPSENAGSSTSESDNTYGFSTG